MEYYKRALERLILIIWIMTIKKGLKLEKNRLPINLSRNDIGAIGELKACVKLMEMGYEVFRAQSPSTKFDIIAYREDNQTSIRVEVRTGMKYKNKIHYGRTKHEKHFDVYAIIFEDDISFYNLKGELININK